MNKKELAERESFEKALSLFDSLGGKEFVDKYIAQHSKQSITKGFIVAYVKKFGTEEDIKWYREEFKKNTYITENKTKKSVVCGLDGEPILLYSKKTGKTYPKKETIKLPETHKVFKITKARDLFLEHFNLTTEISFTAKEARNDYYNVLDEI